MKEAQFPSIITKITDKNNKLKFSVDGINSPITLDIDDGEWNMKQLAEELSSSLREDRVNVKITLLGSGHTQISHTNRVKFELDCTGNSILREFGFKKNKYSGTTSYTSEGVNKLHSNNYYMYIESIYSDKPFYEIMSDGKVKKLINQFDKPIECVNALIVKFKDENGNLVEFGGNDHSYKLELKKLNVSK